jgi:peptidoglycan/xylan/chitin deacetylase (PgdA/CDA1 family)
LQTQYLKVKVANVGNDVSQRSDPFPTDIADGLWSLLSIHPAYKAAEYTLAQAYTAGKDRARAIDHLVVAAALDGEYRNVDGDIDQIFGSARRSFQVASARNCSFVRSSGGQIVEFWSGSTKLKEVALTFDDGPSPQITPILLDNLKKAGVPGTFFVVGIRASAAPDLLREMHSSGFEVENHTYTHPNLGQCLSVHILEEYLRNGIVIRSLTGRWPCFLRPPGGNSNPEVMRIAHECGMIGGFWTVDALRAEDSGSPQEVAQYVVSKARPGAIILMHNGSEATANSIGAMAVGLKARGFKCVTLAQLARDSGMSLP